MNKILTLLLGLILLSAGLVFAQQIPGPESTQSFSSKPVDAGNKYCPVSGRPIGVMGPGVVQEYNGKVYHLCCGGCVAAFKGNPEKYSKIAEAGVVSNTALTHSP